MKFEISNLKSEIFASGRFIPTEKENYTAFALVPSGQFVDSYLLDEVEGRSIGTFESASLRKKAEVVMIRLGAWCWV